METTRPVREGTVRMAWSVLADLLLGGNTAPTSSARAAVLRECRRWWEERLVESSEG